MIIPSIDLQNQSTVQLIGGEELAIQAGDPFPIAERFRLAGEIAVIDLDAALGKGSNRDLILGLISRGPCRVGGGIRDYETAISWLDAGAEKIIIGTAAAPQLLQRLPKKRLIAALDARNGDVCVEGWRRSTGKHIEDCLMELRDYVGGFLITFIEREGRLGGIDLGYVRSLQALAGNARITAAGGVSSIEEIAALDLMGVDAQVGMALYTNKIGLADAIAAPLIQKSPADLWPTIVSDERGIALGLAWSDRESLREAIRLRKGAYRSRKRGLWVKGETSGNTQDLIEVRLDCDRDTLQFIVKQNGPGFCHNNTYTCFGEARGLSALLRTIADRVLNAPENSYTRRLLDDPELLQSKILEESREFVDAVEQQHICSEAVDLIYFTLVRLAKAGIGFEELEAEMSKRALKVTRRGGERKDLS